MCWIVYECECAEFGALKQTTGGLAESMHGIAVSF